MKKTIFDLIDNKTNIDIEKTIKEGEFLVSKFPFLSIDHSLTLKIVGGNIKKDINHGINQIMNAFDHGIINGDSSKDPRYFDGLIKVAKNLKNESSNINCDLLNKGDYTHALVNDNHFRYVSEFLSNTSIEATKCRHIPIDIKCILINLSCDGVYIANKGGMNIEPIIDEVIKDTYGDYTIEFFVSLMTTNKNDIFLITN